MITEQQKSCFMNNYGSPAVTFVRGEGSKLFDESGRAYIDMLAGIAVVSSGHSNPKFLEAIKSQADNLVHVSNLFWTEPAASLAEKLVEITGFGKVFFCNSGAEANECAIKLVRKWAKSEASGGDKLPNGRYKMICAHNSFHGRTMGTLPATGQPAKWKGFEPLGDAYKHCDYNSLEQFENAICEETGAIWLELIQGEGGIVPATREFAQGIRDLCDKHNLVLLLDEVQAGVGRTGSWWSFQDYGIEPDIFTAAKGLGNGLPIGACIAKDDFAVFQPGDHGSTFGGSPVPAAGALASLKYLEAQCVVEGVGEKEALFRRELEKLKGVKEVRGKGLMLAAVLNEEIAKDVAATSLLNGLVVNAVRPNVIRFTPPLVITESEIIQGISILSEAIDATLS